MDLPELCFRGSCALTADPLMAKASAVIATIRSISPAIFSSCRYTWT